VDPSFATLRAQLANEAKAVLKTDSLYAHPCSFFIFPALSPVKTDIKKLKGVS
jgi:hypothetical protein